MANFLSMQMLLTLSELYDEVTSQMIWYPYEQMKTMKELLTKSLDAEGVYLYTEDQKLIDSVSSWWCMIHGYRHPELTAAIKEQADKFCHVMLGGLTHEPVQKLIPEAGRTFLPGDLNYCFLLRLRQCRLWKSP